MTGKKKDKKAKRDNSKNSKCSRSDKNMDLTDKTYSEICSDNGGLKKRVIIKEDGRYLIYYEF